MERINGNEITTMRQEEVELVDLFKILYKNKVIVVVTTVIITLASLGGALYVRANTNNDIAVNVRLKNGLDPFYLGKVSLDMRTFDERDMLKTNRLVNELLTEASLIESFNLKGIEDTQLAKRTFLEEAIKLEKVEEEQGNQTVFRHYQLIMKENEVINEEEVMSKYIEILNRERYAVYKEAIDEKFEEVKEKSDYYGAELEKKDSEIRAIIDEQPDSILRNEGIVGVLSVKYPKTMREQSRIKELYTKYSNELTGIEGLKEDRGMESQVEILSSYYEIKNKSKAKMILIIGVVMGALFGIMGAFLKEFYIFMKKEM